MSDKKRLPSLDGLRAISAAMVVLGHAGKALHVGRNLPFGAGVIDVWGPVGVTVFFVISGYLITRLLLAEKRDRGTISLRAFYMRRTFRILPAYWAYLAVVAVLAASGFVIASPSAFAKAIFFTTNYLNPGSWVVNHSWSLSVEEQFYLFWPFMLLMLGATKARKAAIFLMVATPLMRVITFLFIPDMRPNITSMLHLRVDALMLGCWAALELEEKGTSRVLDFLAHPAIAVGSGFYLLVISCVMRRAGVINAGFGYSIEAFAALSVITWAMRNPDGAVGRVLNSAPFVHFGLISYSLYLWQQLWLSHETPVPVWSIPLQVAGAVLCAEASYRWVEVPMLKLRSVLKPGRAARQEPQLVPVRAQLG
jgi:peptidoglycan/LPS O-acetylase OafA/YrhL